jgi:hypothetical protein
MVLFFPARIDFVISLFAALRGATTLKARTTKDARSLAAVTPYDQGTSCQSISFSGELIEEGVEAEVSCQEHLARGAKFLKRSKRGKGCFSDKTLISEILVTSLF